MIAAAYEAGNKAGIFTGQPPRSAVTAMVSSILQLVPASYERERFDLQVRDLRLGMVRARFLHATADRCYFQILTEQGKTLRVHANEIYPNTLDKPKGKK